MEGPRNGRLKEESLIQPVVLCGGSGTRLWPLSRADRPKPFLRLLGKQTLLQQTLERVADETRFGEPTIVCGAAHVDLVAEQSGPHALIVEPAARNTAPAIALAAARADRDALLLVCPSDHHIADTEAFHAAVDIAADLAREGRLVCFGIAPDRAETGYGYIERGDPLGDAHEVARFVEKPDAATAQQLLESGRYVWNGGIFLFRAGDLLDELAHHRPAMAKAIEACVRAGREGGRDFYPDSDAFAAIEAESIDYAVMELTERAAVVTCDMDWSDIGDWNALMSARERSGDDLLAPGTQCVDARGIMTISDGPRISIVGIDDAIVLVDGDEVVIVSREAAQAVRKLSPAQSK